VIRAVQHQDAKAISDIYNDYIENTAITFEEESVTAQEINKRIIKVQSDRLPWLISEDDSGNVLGYAYASKWRERFSYRFSVEVTVYLSKEHTGKGLGTQLYAALFKQLKANDIHSVIGGITLPNDASVAVHEKFGLKKVAHFTEVGFKFEQWLDVGYWQGTPS
jgi:phosphinothricin acetyltransferase